VGWAYDRSFRGARRPRLGGSLFSATGRSRSDDSGAWGQLARVQAFGALAGGALGAFLGTFGVLVAFLDILDALGFLSG
jgi:hypothetical protein